MLVTSPTLSDNSSNELVSSSLEIPIVDLSQSPNDVGRAIHEACSTIGFFHLINHGVPEELRTQVLQESRNMFVSLPQDKLDEISVAKSKSYRGYQRVGVNITGNKQDGHEGLDLISESTRAIVDEGRRPNGLTNYGVNQWPDPSYVPTLRPTIEEYIEKMNGVGGRLMEAMSLGLGLGPNYFRSYFSDAYWSMRLIRYPAREKDGADESCKFEFGCGEHTDYGIFTMILCDNVKNTLQIRPKGQTEWIMVDPVPGGFVCNIGDMLARWTNGIYVSTPHRVLRPPPGVDRVSVPFFFDPNYDSIIEPIDALVAKSGRPPCFLPIMYGDHFLSKTSSNFDL